MALSAVEEAQLRDLIAQQSALLSLAGVEPTILSKLGASKVTLSDLPSASVINDADLLLLRQGVTDKSVTGATIKGLIPPAGATLQDNKFTGLQTFSDEVSIASASTINLTTADSNNIEITGTTTITAVTMPEGALIKARASGAFQLTNSSSLIVQGGANYTTTVNDILTFTKDGAGNVHVEISKINENSISQLNSRITITDSGTGKIETTIDGVITEELTTASRKSTIDGGSTLYPEFKCRAWVNFNGTGAVAIRASGNVTSITDNGTGDYTINFTTAMPDANYSIAGVSGSNTTAINGFGLIAPAAFSTTSAGIIVSDNSTDTKVDFSCVSVAVFR